MRIAIISFVTLIIGFLFGVFMATPFVTKNAMEYFINKDALILKHNENTIRISIPDDNNDAVFLTRTDLQALVALRRNIILD